jgi:hypothetical protein
VNCKHENADHLMPGQSTEPGYRLHVQNNLVECLRCLDCGHWLPLGPAAPDTDATRIERRAAEMNAPGYSCADDSMMEWAGRRHYIEGHEFPSSAVAQCGWLAQVINDHETHGAP